VRRAETLKQGNDMVGNRARIKVVKNKVAPPFKQAEVDIMYGEGISKEGEILDIGSDLDIVTTSGAWYSYNKERLGQGRENAKQFLKENKEMMDEIHDSIRKHYNLDDDGEEDEETKKSSDEVGQERDRKSTRLNSSHVSISYAVFCLKKKKKRIEKTTTE